MSEFNASGQRKDQMFARNPFTKISALAVTLITFFFCCFAPAPMTHAVVPAPDGGKLGTVLMAANGKVTVPGVPGANPPQAVPQCFQPRAIGQDPKQAMLNRKVEKQATIAELKSTIAQQQKQLEKQQKQMDIFTVQLKEQATQIQKVSAQLEVSKPAPQVVANKP